MKRFVGMLLVMAFAFSIAVVASASPPTKQKAFMSNAAVETVSPVIVRAPVMTGYDVIENISQESRDLSIAQDAFDVDTSARMRLSSTRAWRLTNAKSTVGTARSSPTR